MRVLITGATGLVGKAIVKELHKKGIGINYLTTSKQKLVAEDNYQGFYWNPADNEIDLNSFNGVTAIINLAGASISKRWSSAYKAKVLDSRIDSLRTLRNGIKKSGVKNITSFVSASAIGIYPNSLSSFYSVDEKQVDDSFLGKVVEAWEKEIDAFESFDFNAAKIRIGLVLSQDGGALPQMAKPIKNYVGAAFGSGEQWQSWIHIEDLARMFVYVITNELQGTYNGVAPNPVTNSKLTKELAKVLERPLLLPNIPEFVMKTVLGEMAYLLFASQRVSSKRIEKKGFKFKFLNVCAALEEIYQKEPIKEDPVSSYSKEYV
ncbi:TIGR01777 family oxidoreductase [Croceitalea sp. MTPC9]|uniref:TIGR01777 family oxidoreductase n=1 Tax=unclassified Croceitalea TaxID=2632280 RepID=UPI002B3FA24C|nr:TIGR01777 family oxidoreductase [Croceitalea sp. MTPC6]GMN15084.1 TIGR01777 family oxidoreductase [Croceitalea sp. MTPC9]